MKHIVCINPSCETQIKVEEGELSVECPACGAYYYPDAVGDEASEVGSLDSYNMPDEYDLPSADTNDYNAPEFFESDSEPNSDISSSPSYEPVSEKDWQPESEYSDDNPIPDDYLHEDESVLHSEVQEQVIPIGYLKTFSGKLFKLQKGKNVIGRQGTDIIIDDPTISRRHCVIEVSEGVDSEWEYAISDIGYTEGKSSANGVYINSRSMPLENHERITIYASAQVRLGHTNLTLKIR